MKDNNHSLNKIKLLIQIISLIIGIIFIVIGINIQNNNHNINKNYNDVKATIVSINYNKNNTELVVKYNVNNIEYQNNLSYKKVKDKVGDLKKIYYDKRDPNKIVSKKNNIFAYIFLLTGISILLINLILFYLIIRNNYRIKKIKKNGYSITANIDNIFIVNNKKFINNYPFKLRAVYLNPVDNQTYFYESNLFSKKTKEYLENNSIKQINVYIDKNNTNNYYVDIDSIRKEL